MATINPTLTISGTAADFGAAVSVSITKAITIGNGKASVHKVVTVDDISEETNFTNPQIYDAGQMGRALIYVYNTNADAAGKEIFLTETADEAVDGDVFMHLEPGEFAIFPWASVMDIFATTGANTAGQSVGGLEYMIWEI